MIRIGRLISMRGKSCLFSQSVYSRTAKAGLSTTESQAVNEAENELNSERDKKELLKSYMNLLKQEKMTDEIKGSQIKVKEPERVDTPIKPTKFNKMYPVNQQNLNSLKFLEALEYLKHLSRSKNRAPSTIQVLCDKLSVHSLRFSLKQCSDVLYCLATLSFKDEDLMLKTAETIISKESEFTSGVLPTSILQSLGVLKFRHPKLIEVCLKHTLQHKKQRKADDLLKCLITLATVDFLSPYTTVLIKELSEFKETDFSQTRSYLNFVWSCVLLNQLLEDHISNVLSESYINKLNTFNASVGNNVITDLKLQNINAAAKLLMSSYKGPFLGKTYARPELTKSKFQLLSSVMDGLSYLFPKNGYLKTSKNTEAGFLLDIECCLDAQHKPAMMNKGVHKVAIMLLDYNDLCLGKEKTMNGMSSFKQRILEAEGYKVITIPYTEFPSDISVTDKVNYLKNKLNNV